MDNKIRNSEKSVDRTARIRNVLFFLMFIETKLISKPTYRVSSLDMADISSLFKYFPER